MTAPRCKHCDKNTYTEAEIFRAAINTSRSLGKPVRHYPCPIDETTFHITTMAEAKA